MGSLFFFYLWAVASGRVGGSQTLLESLFPWWWEGRKREGWRVADPPRISLSLVVGRAFWARPTTSKKQEFRTMRNVILLMHVSLDGFVAGPNGEMDWIRFDDQLADDVAALTDTADTALFGRVTYQMM